MTIIHPVATSIVSLYPNGVAGVRDLEGVGRALRARREALGLTREELSRRVGVTPSYVWMVEVATPRTGRGPSRPRRGTLVRWIDALQMDDDDGRDVLGRAGYAPTLGSTRQGVVSVPEVSERRVSEMPSGREYGAAAGELGRLDRPGGRDEQREVLLRRMEDLLTRAARSEERWEEVVGLVETLLDFVSYRVERE